MNPPLTFLIIQTLLCAALPVAAILNWRFLKNTPRRALEVHELPFISICVPARNEAVNIRDCVRTLLLQDYPSFEVLVLDDCSDDGTGEIALETAAGNPRFQLLRGKPLPPGWLGKSHACHQLSETARGEILFFTDADTMFHPECLRYCAEVAAAKHADLLSGVPRLVAKSFWELLSVPILAAVATGLMPLSLLEWTKTPLLAAGSGAFLFFRRAAYEKIGGHAALRGHIVEDVRLTRAIKAAGLRLRMCDASHYVHCRMYRSFAEVWEGFTKNTFAGAEHNWFVLLFVLASILFYGFLPWVWFVLGSSWGWPPLASTALPLIQIASLTLARILTDRLMSTPSFIGTLLIPVSAVFAVLISLVSASRALLRKPTPWKGRQYANFKDEKGEMRDEQ